MLNKLSSDTLSTATGHTKQIVQYANLSGQRRVMGEVDRSKTQHFALFTKQKLAAKGIRFTKLRKELPISNIRNIRYFIELLVLSNQGQYLFEVIFGYEFNHAVFLPIAI